jgi:hypothetical protein
MQTLKPGIIYFLLVFGTGFVLGVFRVLLVVPCVDHKASELFEMPVMRAGSWPSASDSWA